MIHIFFTNVVGCASLRESVPPILFCTMAHSDVSLVALTVAVNTLTDAVSKLTVTMQEHTAPWKSSHVHPPETLQFGLNIASVQARKAMLDICEQLEGESHAEVEKLHLAYALMMPPLCRRNTARALEVLEHIQEIPSRCCKKLRHASLLVRDALILAVCCTKEMTPIEFEFSIECSFQRPISRDLRSQLFLAHACIIRRGRDEVNFGTEVEKLHSPPLAPEEVKALFGVYQTCTTLHQSSTGWDATQEKRSKKKARKPKPSDPDESYTSDAVPAEVPESQLTATQWLNARRHTFV